ncbi:MAG: LysR substrate-binding domain-containing protein [Steroidobacteraceae bacterium]
MKAPLLDLLLLQTLVAVSQTGSLARAAARVGRTQSAVSLQIQKLEALIGTALFDRRGRALVLNEAGRALVRYAERMLALSGEAIAYVRSHEYVGSIKFGMSVDFEHTLLPQAMARFGKTHPKIVVELRVDRNTALDRAVANGELDIALIFGADEPAQRSQLGSTSMAWIAAASFQWSREAALPLLLLEHPCMFRTAAIQALDAAGIAWRIAASSPSLGGLWATAAAGMGVTLRTAAAIPAGLLDVGTRFDLPTALPTVGVKILEAGGVPSLPRQTLHDVLQEIVEDLLLNLRRD